jgi:hypothetical protein
VGLLRLPRAHRDVLRVKRSGIVACRQVYPARGMMFSPPASRPHDRKHIAWHIKNYTVSFTYHENVVPTSETAHKGLNGAVRRHVCGVNVTFAPRSFEGKKPISDDTYIDLSA